MHKRLTLLMVLVVLLSVSSLSAYTDDFSNYNFYTIYETKPENVLGFSVSPTLNYLDGSFSGGFGVSIFGSHYFLQPFGIGLSLTSEKDYYGSTSSTKPIILNGAMYFQYRLTLKQDMALEFGIGPSFALSQVKKSDKSAYWSISGKFDFQYALGDDMALQFGCLCTVPIIHKTDTTTTWFSGVFVAPFIAAVFLY